MTQPPADLLIRIERLVSAGRQQEARLLLVEYIKINPASARAWWLMSLTLTDVARQVDCLQHVVRLDPKNEQARDRLVKLLSQPPVPSVSPFSGEAPVEAEAPPRNDQLAPAWTNTGADAGTSPRQNAEPQAVFTGSTTQAGPVGKKPPVRKSRTRWWILFIFMAVFVTIVIAVVLNYILLQRKADAQFHAFQQTSAMGETLTSLPLPTLIPTWTASPTQTILPTKPFTATPTLTPALEQMLTRTPPPSSLIGPDVGLYAPDFTLTELASGKRVTLSQYDGQPVLLFFWSSLCTQCKNEIGSIQTISQTYKDAGLVVLAINAAEDLQTVVNFRNAHLLEIPILLDPGLAVQSAYHVDALPRHFFINSIGRITSIGKGELTLDELKIRVALIMLRYPTATP
jgi:peroxiredoxin